VIDLRVDGDPAECYGTADELRRLSQAVDRARAGLDKAVNRIGTAWQGGAADACRTKIGALGGDADELHERIDEIGQALERFAAEIGAAKSRMADARDVALAGGLLVDRERILTPTPVPQGLDQATADAYASASLIADEARRRAEAAHQALRHVLGTVSWEFPFDEFFALTDVLTGAVGGTAGLATAERILAARYAMQGSAIGSGLAANPMVSAQTRARATVEALTKRAQARAIDARAAARFAALGKLGPVGKFLTSNLTVLEEVAPFAAKAAPVVSKVPVVGVVGAGIQTGVDIQQRTSVGEAVAKNATTMVAGAATGALTTNALLAASIAGGPAVVVGVLVGAGIAYGVGKAWVHREEIAQWSDDRLDDAGEALDGARSFVTRNLSGLWD
jgi:uncharacterized protein YukE